MGVFGLHVREMVAAVDITASGIAVARVKAGADGRLKVSHAGHAEISAAASDLEIAAALRRLWREARMPTYTVCSCINSGSLLLQYFSYRDLTRSELASALRIEAEDSLQLPGENLVIDWHELTRSELADDQQGTREGVLVTAVRQEVDRHRRLLAMAGLYPVVFDVASLAVCNLWLHLNRVANADEVVFVVNLTRHSANLVVLDGRGRVYPRTILTHRANWGEAADYLVENIVGQEEYAESKLRLPSVSRLLLTGDMPAGKALIDAISAAVAHPVEHWTPLQDPAVRVAGRARRVLDNPEIARRMTVCLGLALRGCDP